jgi:MFS family permease
MFGLIGVANVFDDVGVYSSLQQVIPPRLMGRALGLRMGVLLLSMALGSAVSPLLIHAWGARGTLIATGMLLVVAAVGFLPRLTAIDSRIAAPGPNLALLRRVSFLRPLPFAIVEHLASETTAGDLRTRRRDHSGRGARRALLHHRGGPHARHQGGQAAERDGTG